MLLALDEQTGYLPAEPQLHQVTNNDLRITFVERYPCCHRRYRIWDAYIAHDRVIASFFSARRLEQWVDGGFTTMKNEPGDIDLVTYIPTTELECLDSEVQGRIRAHFRGSSSHAEGLVDIAVIRGELGQLNELAEATKRRMEQVEDPFPWELSLQSLEQRRSYLLNEL